MASEVLYYNGYYPNHKNITHCKRIDLGKHLDMQAMPKWL